LARGRQWLYRWQWESAKRGRSTSVKEAGSLSTLAASPRLMKAARSMLAHHIQAITARPGISKLRNFSSCYAAAVPQGCYANDGGLSIFSSFYKGWLRSQRIRKPSSVSQGAMIWMTSVSCAMMAARPPVATTFIGSPSSLRNLSTIPSTMLT